MGIIILVVLFAIIAIVWGLPSISQFYAAAKHAQATIDVAHAPQIFATSYLIAILIIVLLILAGLVTVIGTLWLLYRLVSSPPSSVLEPCGADPPDSGSSTISKLLRLFPNKTRSIS